MFNQPQDLVWVPGICMYGIDFNICRLHTIFFRYYIIDHYRSHSAKSHPLYVFVFFFWGGGGGLSWIRHYLRPLQDCREPGCPAKPNGICWKQSFAAIILRWLGCWLNWMEASGDTRKHGYGIHGSRFARIFQCLHSKCRSQMHIYYHIFMSIVIALNKTVHFQFSSNYYGWNCLLNLQWTYIYKYIYVDIEMQLMLHTLPIPPFLPANI